MRDLGPLQFEQQSGSVFLGRDYNKPQHFSNEVANEIDIAMRKIIDDCHKKATEIIKKNKDVLKLIAETLLEYETLTKLRKDAKEHGIEDADEKTKAELIKELGH